VTVKIIVATSSADNTQRWCGAFQQAWPDASILAWSDDAPATDARYAIVWNPPAGIFQRERKLEAAFNLGAGVDRLMTLPGLSPSLPIVRLEDAGMSEQMAEYVVYALLHASREFGAYAAQQRQARWNPLPAVERRDWPVGIMGLGAMGARVAQAVASLGYPVTGWSRTPRDIAGVQSYSGAEGFEPFLASTRALVNLLPLTPATEGILNRKNLSLLRDDAYLINVARGQHLVEEDLLALLDEGRLCGAMLDVFHAEPLPQDHPFWRHPKIVVTPHVAAITLERDTVSQIIGKIQRLLRAEPISGVVNRATGY
jgi:glyoxylate/hydroxypyruvate reductase A